MLVALEWVPQGPRLQVVPVQVLQRRHRLRLREPPLQEALAVHLRAGPALVALRALLVRVVVPVVLRKVDVVRRRSPSLHLSLRRVVVLLLVLPLPKPFVDPLSIQSPRHIEHPLSVAHRALWVLLVAKLRHRARPPLLARLRRLLPLIADVGW